MTTDPETLYRQLGRLIETMPDLAAYPVPAELHQWAGRAYALVSAVGNIADAALMTVAVSKLGTRAREDAVQQIIPIVYRALAVAELRAPPGVAGAFIPAGNSFDAFSALSKILQSATKDVLIVDPYMDETVLTEFGGLTSPSVCLRLMADQSFCKSSLQPAALKWVQQHGTTTRPLSVRLAPQKTLHDRAIFIDHTTAWTLTQSLKDFAKRSPAELVRADDTAALKISAYEGLWNSAQVVV